MQVNLVCHLISNLVFNENSINFRQTQLRSKHVLSKPILPLEKLMKFYALEILTRHPELNLSATVCIQFYCME